MADNAQIRLNIISPDIDRIQKWFDDLEKGKLIKLNVDADLKMAEDKIKNIESKAIRLNNVTINAAQFKKQLDTLKSYASTKDFSISFSSNGLDSISDALDRMEQQARTISDAFQRMNSSIVTDGDALDRRFNNRIRSIESKFLGSDVANDIEKLDRFNEYVQLVRDNLADIRANNGDDNDAILRLGDAEIHRLREYASLLGKLDMLDMAGLQHAADGLNEFRAIIPGAAQRIDDLQQQLSDSVDDPLGLLRVQREIQQTEAEFAGFVKKREALNKSIIALENDSKGGLFGAEGSDELDKANKLIDELKQSLARLSADSSKSDWLGIDAQIKKLQKLKAEYKGSFATASLSETRKSLQNDIAAYRSTTSGISPDYQKALDDLINQIKTADKLQLSNLRQQFVNLKKEIAEASNGIEAQRNKLDKLIGEWEQLHPGSAERLRLEIDKLRKAIQSADAETLDKLEREFKDLTDDVSILGGMAKSLGSSLKNAFNDLTPYALIARGGQMIENAFEDSLTTLREVDTYLTEISKVSSRTATELDALSDSAFTSASKWGVDVTTYLQGAQEWSRSGYEAQSEALAELTVLAQSAGDMTSDVATSYLIATNAAYQYAGDAKALTAVLDGQNQITNRNAVSMQELAEATKVAGAQAASAGLDIGEFSAAVGTIQAVTQQGGSVAGRAFKAILMNLQQISGVTEDGDVIDAASFNKVEKALAAVGVATSEVRDGLVKLRDPMEVLRDLAAVFETLDPQSVERANIISALGGKQRGAQLAALLSNWDIYEKQLADFNDNAMGSAAAEAEKSAKSWEGSLARVNNSFAQLVDALVNSGDIKALIDLFDGFAQGLNGLVSMSGSGVPRIVAFAAAFKMLKGLLDGGHMLGSVRDVGAAFKLLADNVRSNYAAARKTAPALKSMQSALKKTKADAIATGGAVKSLHGVLTGLASTVGSLLISAAVQWAVNAISDKIHEAERIKEEAEQALSEYDETLSRNRTNRTSAKALASEYALLSKGVSEHGENMSLTSDEYSRYIDLSNQLSDLVPDIVSGWDSQGNAIISVRGSVEELNKVLDTYYEKQDKIARAALLEDANNILANARNEKADQYDDKTFDATSLSDEATGQIIAEKILTPEMYESIVRAALNAAAAYDWNGTDGPLPDMHQAIVDELDAELAAYIEGTNAINVALSEWRNGTFGNGKAKFDLERMAAESSIILGELNSANAAIDAELAKVRKVFEAAALESWNYDNLSFSMQSMLNSMVSSMDVAFALDENFDRYDVSVYVNDLIADMLDLQAILPDAAKDMQEFKNSFDSGAIGYGAYTNFAKDIITQANEISETFGASIEDYLVGDLTQFEAKYQDMVQRLTRGMTLSDGELEWLNALTMDELTTLYNLKLTTSGNLTLPELWALYEQAKDEPVITQTFSFGDYTDDLETLEKRATALKELLNGIQSGALTSDELVSHTQAHPDDAAFLKFIGVDGTIDMSGLKEHIEKELQQEYSDLITELKAYSENMTADDDMKPIVDGLIAHLEQELNDVSTTSFGDVDTLLTGYQTAMSALREGLADQTVDGALSPDALKKLHTAFESIGLDAEAYIANGIINGDAAAGALKSKAAELQSMADDIGLGELIANAISGDDEQVILDSLDSVYNEGLEKIQLLQGALETLANNELVDNGTLLEIEKLFGAGLAESIRAGDYSSLINQLFNVRDAYQSYIATLAEGSDKGAAYAESLSDALGDELAFTYASFIGRQKQIGLLDERLELIQRRIDLNEQRGRSATMADYGDLIRAESERKNQYSLLKNSTETMRNVHLVNDDENYKKATERIEEYEQIIAEADANIIAWNNEMLASFGFDGMAEQLGTLTDTLTQAFTEQAGNGVTGSTASALATWLKSMGANASDYIRTSRTGIEIDNAALRVLAQQTLTDTIAGLRAQLATANTEERAAIQFNIDLLVNAQTELLNGTSAVAQLEAAYAQLSSEMETVGKAMAESASETGITTATYRELINANSDYMAALEYSGGIYRLNTDAVNVNLDAKREQILAETEAARASDFAQYEKNTERIEELTKGYDSLEAAMKNLSGTDLKELFDLGNANQELAQAINGYNLLSASLDDATYAYSKWLSAQQGPKGDEWYYAGQEAYQDLLDGIESGKTGKGTAYAAAEELFFGDMGSTEQGMKSLERYFKIDEDDPIEQERKNLQNFLDDLEKWEYIVKDSNGKYTLSKAIGLDELKAFTGFDEFGLKSLFQNLETFDFDIDWAGMYPDLGDAAQTYLAQLDALVTSAKTKLAELEKDGISETESAEADALKQIIAVYENADWSENVGAAQDALQTEVDGLDAVTLPWTFDAALVAEEAAKLAAAISSALNGGLDIGNMDSQVDGKNIADTAGSIQTELEAIKLQLDTGDTEAALNRLVEIINRLIAMTGILASRNIGDLGANEAASALLRVYDQLRRINAFRIDDKTFAVRSIDMTGGAANAHGTPSAKPGSTLVGELKPEMLIRGNRWQLVGEDGAEFVNLQRGDIVIDGDNTERLLKGRKGARGTAMAHGGQVGGQAAAYGIDKFRLEALGSVIKEEAEKAAEEIAKGAITGFEGSLKNSSGTKKSSSKSSTSSKSSGSSSSAASDTKEWLDWIEVKLSRLQRQIDNLIKDADAGIGYLAKNESLSDALDIVIAKIDAAKKAYTEYMEHADEVAKKGGLSQDLISKVQTGDISIGSYSSSTQSLISEYQEWYEKALAVKDELYELNELQTELATKKLDNIISSYQQQLDELAQTLELMQGEIDLGITTGKNISESQYEEMKANKQQQQQLLMDKRETLQGEFDAAVASGAIKEGSDEWYEYKGEILETSLQINDCAQAIAKYQEEIDKLRIMRHEYAADEVGFRRAALEDAVTLKKVTGQVVDESDYRPQLELMKEHAQKYNELLNEYKSQLSRVEKGSQKYYELSRNVAQVEADIRALGIEQAELNRLILEMPLQRYENLLEILEGEHSLLQGMMDLHEAQGEYLTAAEYEALISSADEQLENLQKQRGELEGLLAGVEEGSDLWQEYKTQLQGIDAAILDIKAEQEEWNDSIIDLQIEQLEKQKKLLEEQNDEYERRVELEKALQELERAKAQKNIQIYREGIGFVWEADQEAIRDAEEALAEKRHEEMLDKIDEAIEALDEYKKVDNLYDYFANRINQSSAATRIDYISNEKLGTYIADAVDLNSGYFVKQTDAALKQGLTDMVNALKRLSVGSDSPITIGAINLSGVQDVNGLAQAIVKELPGKLTQALYSKNTGGK